ncbi:hypothetical protein ACLOJK_037475 [Asimina triloba]
MSTQFAVHHRSTNFGAPSSSPWPAAMATGGELPGGDAEGRSKPPKMTATTRGFRSLYLLHQSMHRMYKNQKPISIFVRQPWLPNPPPTATICSILLNVEQPSSTLQQRPNPPIQSSNAWPAPTRTIQHPPSTIKTQIPFCNTDDHRSSSLHFHHPSSSVSPHPPQIPVGSCHPNGSKPISTPDFHPTMAKQPIPSHVRSSPFKH